MEGLLRGCSPRGESGYLLLRTCESSPPYIVTKRVATREDQLLRFQERQENGARKQREQSRSTVGRVCEAQLAARRSLASMPLEEILTNRNRLSEDIRRDVKEAASSYGVTIFRADVKDLIFPGNLPVAG